MRSRGGHRMWRRDSSGGGRRLKPLVRDLLGTAGRGPGIRIPPTGGFPRTPVDASVPPSPMKSHRNPIGWRTAVMAVLVAASAHAQGTFVASNAAGPRTFHVTGCDGKPLAGTNFMVALLVRNPASDKYEGGLQRVGGDSQASPVAAQALRDGAQAGVFSFGTVRVPFVAPGQDADVLVRVWDASGGKDFAAAAVRGETNVPVRLGGAGNPPTFPPRLSSFRGLVVCGTARQP